MMNQLSPEAISFLNQFAKSMTANQAESPWVKENVEVIYTNPQHPSGLWSMRGERENEFIDCPSSRLKGRISRLWYTEKEPGKIRWYLRLECAGDRSFIIQSTHKRGFSRSMLAAISMMTVDQVRAEVIVQCNAWQAKEGPMQFCAIYAGEQLIDSPRIEDEHVGAIARAAQSVVADACGYDYSPVEQLDSQHDGSQAKPASTSEPAPPDNADYSDIPF